jgi:hypothetical protein
MEWRQFGSAFQHLRVSNTVVFIETLQKSSSSSSSSPMDASELYLRWSFGHGLNRSELSYGYEMKVVQPAKSRDAYVEVTYSGTLCHGRWCQQTNTCVINFFLPNSTVTATYRIVDDSTIAICIAEVDEKQMPTIQYGIMKRIPQ